MKKLSWETVEYFHTEKTADWYWIVGIVTVSIAIISIILNNVIFAILILVSSFTLALFASRRPHVIAVELNEGGIMINKTLYPYSSLESFWVETREFHPRILIKSKKLVMHLITIFIEEVKPDEVQTFLSQYLPEEEHREPFLEKVLLYLGF